MFGALVLMPLVVMFGPGGGGVAGIADPGAAWTGFPRPDSHGLTALGWLSAVTWGLGYFGQPHIIVRFMAIRSVETFPRRAISAWRGWSCAWRALSASGWRAAPMSSATGIAVEDPETIFIVLAELCSTR